MNRETKDVIFDIERCICHVPDACKDCSKFKNGVQCLECMEDLLTDALALLKEQTKIDCHKCGDCKWLDMAKKRKVGNMCVNPNIKHTGMGYIKYKSSRACKRGFKPKDGKE